MLINCDEVLKGLDEEPLKEKTKDGEINLTLGGICVSALMNAPSASSAKPLTGEDKFRRCQLAQRLYKGGERELSVGEAALLKELIGTRFAPVVIGATWPLLDG